MSAVVSPLSGKGGDKDNMASRMDDAVELVVGILVASLLAAFLLPIAIDEISNTSTGAWDANVITIWDLLPVMIVLAAFLLFVGWAVSVYRKR